MLNIPNSLIFSLLFIWQLPQCILALLMMPFIGEKHLISYKNYCYLFKASKMSGGISLGCFAFVEPKLSENKATLAHEQIGHVKQSHMLGWLYLIIIGLPSLIWATCYQKFDIKNYSQFYTEKWANSLAGIKTKCIDGQYFDEFENVQ